MLYCQKCGAQVSPDVRFCPTGGAAHDSRRPCRSGSGGGGLDASPRRERANRPLDFPRLGREMVKSDIGN